MSASGTDLDDNSPPAERATKPTWAQWVMAAIVSLCAIRAVADVNFLHVVWRYVASSFSVPPSEIRVAMVGYGVGSVVGFVLVAAATRRLGGKKIFLISVLLFGLASALCGMAPTPDAFGSIRAVQGLLGGGLLAATLVILFGLFPRARRGSVETAFGVGCVLVGSLLGPTLGAYITDNFSWRWIFNLTLPLTVLAAILALIFLPKDGPIGQKSASLNWREIGLTALGLGAWNYFFALPIS